MRRELAGACGSVLRLYQDAILFDDVDVRTSEPISRNDELIAVGDEQIRGTWEGYLIAFEAIHKNRDRQVTVTLRRGEEVREVILDAHR